MTLTGEEDAGGVICGGQGVARLGPLRAAACSSDRQADREATVRGATADTFRNENRSPQYDLSAMGPQDEAEPAGQDQELDLRKAGLTLPPRKLFRPLSRAQAVRWSEENLLAVAIADAVCICCPDPSEDLRGVVSLGNAAGFRLQGSLGIAPDGADNHLNFRVKGSNRDVLHAPPTMSRDLSWSPLGVSRTGGCVLAVCTSGNQVRPPQPPKPSPMPPPDHTSQPRADAFSMLPIAAETQVSIYGPGSGPCAWDQLVDLSAKLKEHLEASKWKEAHTRPLGAPSRGDSVQRGSTLAAAASDAAASDVLRLRGGGRTPSTRSSSRRRADPGGGPREPEEGGCRG